MLNPSCRNGIQIRLNYQKGVTPADRYQPEPFNRGHKPIFKKKSKISNTGKLSLCRLISLASIFLFRCHYFHRTYTHLHLWHLFVVLLIDSNNTVRYDSLRTHFLLLTIALTRLESIEEGTSWYPIAIVPFSPRWIHGSLLGTKVRDYFAFSKERPSAAPWLDFCRNIDDEARQSSRLCGTLSPPAYFLRSIYFFHDAIPHHFY